MKQIELTKRYFTKLTHVKNYIEVNKPKTKSEITHNLHIDSRICYELFENKIIQYNSDSFLVWNNKIPLTNKLAETISIKVISYNNNIKGIATTKVPSKIEKVGLIRRVWNWLF